MPPPGPMSRRLQSPLPVHTFGATDVLDVLDVLGATDVLDVLDVLGATDVLVVLVVLVVVGATVGVVGASIT